MSHHHEPLSVCALVPGEGLDDHDFYKFNDIGLALRVQALRDAVNAAPSQPTKEQP